MELPNLDEIIERVRVALQMDDLAVLSPSSNPCSLPTRPTFFLS